MFWDICDIKCPFTGDYCSLSRVEFPEHRLRFSNATTTLSSHSCTVRVFRGPVLAAALRARIPRNNFANWLAQEQFQVKICQLTFSEPILRTSLPNCFLKCEYVPWLAYSARLVEIAQQQELRSKVGLDLMLYKLLILVACCSGLLPLWSSHLHSSYHKHCPFHDFILAPTRALYVTISYHRTSNPASCLFTHPQSSCHSVTVTCLMSQLWHCTVYYNNQACFRATLLTITTTISMHLSQRQWDVTGFTHTTLIPVSLAPRK